MNNNTIKAPFWSILSLLLERVAGIEPATCPWQGYVLPLAPHPHYLVVGQGFEPCRSSPSGQSPELIRLRRIPMLPTILSTLGLLTKSRLRRRKTRTLFLPSV